MGNPAQMQTQVTPPAVLHLAAMIARHRIGTDGDQPLPPVSPTETYGVTPQVAPKALSGKLNPKDCTTDQLFEIVIDVARRFRTAKEVVAEHKDYIVALKTNVFKVRFGSVGARVLVTWKTEEGLPAGTTMNWKEFCESQFGVSADWINRICCGKAEGPGQGDTGSSTPDWKTVLVNLVKVLEQCGDSLPLQAKEALHVAKEVLEGMQTSNDSGAATSGQEVATLGQGSRNRMSSEFLIVRADARHIPLADNSVQCIVTSPPYFGLRRYAGNQELVWGGAERCEHEWYANGTRKQSPQRDHAPDGSFGKTRGVEKSRAGMAFEASLGSTCRLCGAWLGAFGLEPTVDAYIQHTVEILREVRRVLRTDGVCFWNVGDSRSGSGKGIGSDHDKAVFTDADIAKTNWKDCGLKPKDLCLIPQRIALAAQEDGWWVRSDIIWALPNAMPESATDRPTDAYEHILMLTKSERYAWNAEAVKEAAAWERWGKQTTLTHDENQRVMPDKSKEELQKNTTRNRRNVWTFATQPYKGAHFATFPDKLPLHCIRAACPDKGCCRFCGTPWKRVTKVGWTPGCKCRGQRGITKPCLVLDPFGGAGTTGLAASELKQDCVLLDISAEYVQMMRERLKRKIADTAQIEIDNGDPPRNPGSPPGCADRGVGIVPPPRGLPAPDSDAVLGA
ncbi:MAG: site-specific DNA-methyltransferase [Terriglobia bacterium]